jgi:hypothetical protein
MNERAVLLGGTLRIKSAPGQGSAVIAHLPVLPAHITNVNPEDANHEDVHPE